MSFLFKACDSMNEEPQPLVLLQKQEISNEAGLS
jgi:hypothetical protein